MNNAFQKLLIEDKCISMMTNNYSNPTSNEMNIFEICFIHNRCALIVATSYINPISYLPEIEKQIASFNGEVYIDLLLVNGNSYNRFIKCYFDDGKFDRSTMQVIQQDKVPLGVTGTSTCFYRSNPTLVEANQILGEEEKLVVLTSIKS